MPMTTRRSFLKLMAATALAASTVLGLKEATKATDVVETTWAGRTDDEIDVMMLAIHREWAAEGTMGLQFPESVMQPGDEWPVKVWVMNAPPMPERHPGTHDHQPDPELARWYRKFKEENR